MTRKIPVKASSRFQPFADDAAVESFGAFSIENGTGRIAVHGSLDLTRDRHGLERAWRLKAIVDAIVSALESQLLPDEVAERAEEPASVKNPFA